MPEPSLQVSAYIDEAGLLMLAAAPPVAGPWIALCREVLSKNSGAGLATSEHALLEVCRFFEARSTRQSLRRFLGDSEPFLEEVTPVRTVDMIRATDLAQDHEVPFRVAVNAAVAIRRGYALLISPEPAYDRLPSIRRIQP